MKVTSLKTITVLLICTFSLFAQVPQIEGWLEHFEVFYFSDFDFNNASNNPLFFSYTFRYDGGSPGDTDLVSFHFEVNITIPSLNIDAENLFFMTTDPFPFPTNRQVTVTSQDVDYNFDLRFDNGDPVFPPGLHKEIEVNSTIQSDIQQILLQTGKLPAGTYEFLFRAEGNYGVAEKSESVTISNPATLDLVSPGGALEDNIEITSTFPVFQWESAPFYWRPSVCPECGYWIRVAEYIPGQHSSIEEALNDEASLPYPDDGGYYKIMDHSSEMNEIVTDPTTFQYPLSGARTLEPGHTYVWQLKKIFPTTSGPEEVQSDIFVFTITAQSSGGGTTGANPLINTLSQIIDPGVLEQLFGEGGELQNFSPTGLIYSNGEVISLTDLTNLVNQVINGELNLQDIRVEE